MKIGGILDMSTIDYPGKIASVIFTYGCNFRCPFCQNFKLVTGGNFIEMNPDKILEILNRQKKFVDAVVITGGEPTLQPLEELCRKLKQNKYFVKLDTNGSNPDVLKTLVDKKLIDFVAMDIKARFNTEDYKTVTKADCFENVKRSYDIILNSDIDYEFRMPVVPGLNDFMIEDISKGLGDAKHIVLEQFVSRNGTLDPAFKDVKSPSREELVRYAKMFTNRAVKVRSNEGEEIVSK